MSTKSMSEPQIVRWWWLVAAVTGLVYAILSSAVYIPDSYEHVILAECMGQGVSGRIDCSDIVLTFRPPLPALLLIAISPFAHPLYGIALISWLSATAVPALFWRLAPPSISLTQRLSVVGILLASPLFHVFAQLADARMVVLPFMTLLGLSLWRMSEGIEVKHSARCAAIAVVLASLTRPEAVLLLPLAALWLGWQQRESLKGFLLWSLPPMVVWWSILSASAGRLVFAPRHWEGTLLAAWDFMPLRWSKQLYGMGLWSPPARQAALSLSPASSVPELSISAWLDWLYSGLDSLFAIWLWPLLLLIIVVGLWRTEHRRVALLGVLCAAPNLVGALLPQARDPLFQISNLFPLWLILLIGLGLAIGQLLKRMESPISRMSLVLIAVGLSWWGGTVPDLKNGLEVQSVGQEATAWLRQNTTADQRIVSSFESAPVVFLAERQWEQWPSIWDEQRLFESPAPILMISSEDGFWAGNTRFREPLPPPAAYFGIHGQWILIYDLAARN